MTQNPDWNRHDTKLAWKLTLEEMKRKSLYVGRKSCLHMNEKRDCLASLSIPRPLGGLKFKMSNLKSALLYIIRHGQDAGAHRRAARAKGEREQYVAGKRVIRGCLHGSEIDLSVVERSIAKGEVSFAMMLTLRFPALTNDHAGLPGYTLYREMVEKLVAAGTNALPLITPTLKLEFNKLALAISEAKKLLKETRVK